MLPKVRTPGDVEMTDKLLTQIELATGLEVGRIGIEAQIEDATGLLACEAIAAASPRMETLIFGPGDYSAAVGIPITTIGAAPDGYPGDHLNYVYTRLVVAARAAGIQAIDGPYGNIKDDDGLRARAQLARALGLDGKWTIHPGQIATVNEIFSPAREQWERAETYARRLRRGPPQRSRRGYVRGRDDRRGQPQDGRADRVRGPRGRVRAMSSGARLSFLAIAVVILVVAFVALRPSSDDPETTADAPTATPTATATATPEANETETPTPTASATPQPTVDPGPLLTGSEVVKLRYDKGETVRFRVRSPVDEEVHVHGYDLKKDVKAGQTAAMVASRRPSTASSRSSSSTPRSRSPNCASTRRRVTSRACRASPLSSPSSRRGWRSSSSRSSATS